MAPNRFLQQLGTPRQARVFIDDELGAPIQSISGLDTHGNKTVFAVDASTPHSTDPLEWHQYITDATPIGQHFDHLSDAPQSVRMLLEIGRPVGGSLAVPHTLRGDEASAHLNPEKLRFMFNCHSTVASRLAELFATFEFDAHTVNGLAHHINDYNGPLGLAFYLESLALKADFHPSLSDEQDEDEVSVELVPYDDQHIQDESFTGTYESISYHRLPPIDNSQTETILPPQTARHAWPQWVNELPNWAKMLSHRIPQYSKASLQQAAHLLKEHGSELSSSSRQYLWDLIKDRFLLFRPAPPEDLTRNRDYIMLVHLIEHAETPARLHELAIEIASYPEIFKVLLRPIWQARMDVLLSHAHTPVAFAAAA